VFRSTFLLVLHAQPISFITSVIKHTNIILKSTKHEVHHFTIFSIKVL
jgi:hypothetical protein